MIITFLYGIVFTLTDFRNIPFHTYYDFSIILLQWATVSFATFGLLYILSVNRYIFAFIFPVLTGLCSILAYFRWTANVSFTPMILDATLDNDIKTSMDLITLNLLLFFTSSFIASILLARYRFKFIKVSFKAIHIIIALAILLLTNFFFLAIKNPVSERIPFSLFYTSGKFFSEKQIITENRISLSDGATCDEDSLIVVFVLGESLRPDHLGINGYVRNTTPYISKENVISYPNIYSEYTHTNKSVPHIMTRADSTTTEKAFNERSFIGIFKSGGYKTTWLANQESADTYVYFMHEADNLQYANISKSLYNYDKWIDEDLIPYFDQELQKNNPKKLIILHTIGSHWWYNAHFPDSFELFKPIIKSKIISSCTQEEMINSYDNTVIYSDFFFKQVIDRLKEKNAIVIYLSDHGEALGENNQWLHAHDNPILHKTACFLWMSPRYKERYPDKFSAAVKNASKKWRTDFLFHTILSAGSIKSPYFIKDFDILTHHENNNGK